MKQIKVTRKRVLELSKLKGIDLFKKYSKRNYTGDANDEYAQLLLTIFGHIGEDIFELLTDAEKQNKRLVLRNENKEEYSLQDVIFK